jgi:DNA repair protein RecN (Recombination protein N)
MLRHLRVTNFAILSDVALDLGAGLSALTGETGAGKSLIVEAVNLLRGGRASADIPRAGADEAVVEAIVELPDDLRARVEAVMAGAGLPVDDEVLIRRVIHRGGRSRTYVNGALTTAKVLAELGSLLIDLSGQHQHQGLVDPRRHRQILDAFAEEPELVAAMRDAWAAMREAEAALEALGGDERTRAERTEYLRFQRDELEQAGLRSGEDAELEAERERLASADRLESGARLAEEHLYAGEDAAVDRLGAAARELERLVGIDPTLGEPLRQIAEARVLAEEAAAALRHYADGLDGDPGRLATVDDRLALLRRLERKHGCDLAQLVERAGELAAELEALENRDERVTELEKVRRRAERTAREAATALSAARRRAAERLSAEVGAALAELGMGAARLSVSIEARPLGPDGADKVELLLAANKGEDAKPLAKIASGGELSRIMLALKLSLRRADEVATYVFDEVDTGIGGATAEVVGRQIRAIADHRQVICVTHLPQIAAFADTHFHVAKFELDGRTETAVRSLTPTERRDETARMLGGLKLTPRARAHATEILRSAQGRSSQTPNPAPPRSR